MTRIVLPILLAVVILGAGAAAQSVQPDTDNQRAYLIGPGDEITGKVLGEPQFDFVATVDENGNIEIPFFDKPVPVKCLSETDLKLEVTKLLKKYLKNPLPSVRVTKRDSRPPVSVYGEVRQQQQFSLTRRIYLLEVVSAAGGVTEKSGGVIQVFRTRPPICTAPGSTNDWKAEGASDLGVPFRMFSIASLREGREDGNPEIMPGDIIVVPKADPVYMTGEVLKPGEISIPEGGLPLTQAIAMASGITREAKTKNVKIYRRKAGAAQPEVITANFEAIRKGQEKDILLKPYDIVEVDKAPKGFMDYVIEFATGIPNRIPIRPL